MSLLFTDRLPHAAAKITLNALVSRVLAVVKEISKAQARRVTLTAQGFAKARPQRVTKAHLTSTLSRLAAVQIDSINVLTRSHYLPFFARLGPYDTSKLDELCAEPPLQAVEYWAHEASIVPAHIHELLGFRMHRGARLWGSIAKAAAEHSNQLPIILGYLKNHGPCTARELAAGLGTVSAVPKQHWGWNWSTSKKLLEYLFYKGAVTSCGRNSQFERRYHLMERCVASLPRVCKENSHRSDIDSIVAAAISAVGVGSTERIADYFRLQKKETQESLDRLAGIGAIQQIVVEGLSQPHWAPRDMSIPRSLKARALLSPFDSAVWHRPTLEELYGIRHRLEVYVPAAKRVYGYYVLLFLLDDAFVARVDLKHERQAKVLQVKKLSLELHCPPNTVEELAAELEVMAQWLDAEGVAWPN